MWPDVGYWMVEYGQEREVRTPHSIRKFLRDIIEREPVRLGSGPCAMRRDFFFKLFLAQIVLGYGPGARGAHLRIVGRQALAHQAGSPFDSGLGHGKSTSSDNFDMCIFFLFLPDLDFTSPSSSNPCQISPSYPRTTTYVATSDQSTPTRRLHTTIGIERIHSNSLEAQIVSGYGPGACGAHLHIVGRQALAHQAGSPFDSGLGHMDASEAEQPPLHGCSPNER
ncbi:hypothetical protein B0H14DRAFT_2652888, partial [Mycena olivaceomarginata]